MDKLNLIKSMCDRYDLSYNRHKKEISKMLSYKVKHTKQKVTDTDVKEVCKLIAETRLDDVKH